MVIDIGDGLGQVGVGGVGTVNEGEGVVAHSAQFQGVGEAVMHGPHVHEAAGVDHGKFGPRLSPEQKQPCIPFGWVRLHLLLGVNGVKDLFPSGGPADHVIDDLHGLIRLDVAVPDVDTAGAHLSQRHVLRYRPVHREQQTAKIPQHGVGDHLAHSGFPGHGHPFHFVLCGPRPVQKDRPGFFGLRGIPAGKQRTKQDGCRAGRNGSFHINSTPVRSPSRRSADGRPGYCSGRWSVHPAFGRWVPGFGWWRVSRQSRCRRGC